MSDIKHRKVGNESINPSIEAEGVKKGDKVDETKSSISPTFWLTRIVYIRAIGLIYFVAFLVALNQVVNHVFFQVY